jgi:hypothetical protein
LHDGILLPTPYTFHHSHVLIYYLNTKSLSLHKNDVLVDYNPKTSHILCLNETHFHQQTSSITSFINLEKYYSISAYAQNDTMIIYDKSTIQPNELKFFMNHYSIEFQFKEITIIYSTCIDHKWMNTPTQQCM